MDIVGRRIWLSLGDHRNPAYYRIHDGELLEYTPEHTRCDSDKQTARFVWPTVHGILNGISPEYRGKNLDVPKTPNLTMSYTYPKRRLRKLQVPRQ